MSDRSGAFHPSGLRCPRSALYQFYGIPSRVTKKEVQKIYSDGHNMHNRIQDRLTALGILDGKEIEIRLPEYHIRGNIDGKLKLDGCDGGLEIKSMNPYYYSKLEDVPEHYKDQVQIYLHATGFSVFWMLFANKDLLKDESFSLEEATWEDFATRTEYFKWIPVTLDQKKVDEVLGRVQSWSEFLKFGSTGPRSCLWGKTSDYCGYGYRCLKDGELESWPF